MKLIIAGSRTIFMTPNDMNRVIEQSGFLPNLEMVVSGGCKYGVDVYGEIWAKARGIKTRVFLADWKHFAKSAGPRRNRAMANYADALLAVWDVRSRGTQNMIDEAIRKKLEVVVAIRKQDEWKIESPRKAVIESLFSASKVLVF